jgi:serine/threonine protein kinase
VGETSEITARPSRGEARSASKSSPSKSRHPGGTEPSRPEPCLSEEQVLAFSEGSLMPSAMDSVHAHLDWCSTCQELVNAAVHRWDHPPTAAGADRIWMATFAPGQTIAGGRYRIDRFLERGGMGEVYAAFDDVLGERVALKTLLSTKSDNPHAVRRLLSEARLARRVSHPNVCRVHDVGVHEEPGRVDERLYFLTMEFIEGRRLGQVLRTGPLELDLALNAARQVLAGLKAAHEAGVLHRDLKSDNIMLSGAALDSRIAITDFGLSQPLGADARAVGVSGQELVGSLAYMAPEQIRGAELGPETDVFAFGVVLFEMLCGRLPFVSEGRSAKEVAERRLTERPQAPSHLRPELPPQLDQLVLRCLELAPEARFASAAQVLGELG